MMKSLASSNYPRSPVIRSRGDGSLCPITMFIIARLSTMLNLSILRSDLMGQGAGRKAAENTHKRSTERTIPLHRYKPNLEAKSRVKSSERVRVRRVDRYERAQQSTGLKASNLRPSVNIPSPAE